MLYRMRGLGSLSSNAVRMPHISLRLGQCLEWRPTKLGRLRELVRRSIVEHRGSHWRIMRSSCSVFLHLLQSLYLHRPAKCI